MEAQGGGRRAVACTAFGGDEYSGERATQRSEWNRAGLADRVTTMPRRILMSLACVVFALGACEGTLRAAEMAQYQSNHYVIQTELPREEAAPFGRHMDAVFAEYSQRFKDFGPRQKPTMPLYLLKDNESYLRFLGSYGINGANTGGMFFVTPKVQGLATFVRGRSMTQTFMVLQHEGFHQFAFHCIGPQLPVWVNEGLAQYFEDGILIGERMNLGMANGRRIASVRSAMKSGRVVDFDRLLSMSDKEWHQIVSRGDQEATLLYDQSWLIAHFLINSDQRIRAAFEKYLHLVADRHDSADAFRKAFETDSTVAFRARWEDYAAKLEPDAMAVAMDRMLFLGEALRFLKKRDDRMPQSTEALRTTLQKMNFRATRQEIGRTMTISASDETLYRYTASNGSQAMFRMLPAEKPDLLPRIFAPGISPEPTLAWRRDPDGELIAEFVFR